MWHLIMNMWEETRDLSFLLTILQYCYKDDIEAFSVLLEEIKQKRMVLMDPYFGSGHLEGLFLLQLSIKKNITSKACNDILFP